jgi:hypothetical protein
MAVDNTANWLKNEAYENLESDVVKTFSSHEPTEIFRGLAMGSNARLQGQVRGQVVKGFDELLSVLSCLPDISPTTRTAAILGFMARDAEAGGRY